MNTWKGKTDICLMQLATLGPLGRIPFAPGTWGSLAAVILAPWLIQPLPWAYKILLLLILFLLGSWSSSAAERILGQKDPGCVVIDEFLGQMLVFAICSRATPWQLAAGFVLFRLYDIVKPWPVRASENWLSSGWGIMLDDILAGAYAGLSLLLLQFLIKSFS